LLQETILKNFLSRTGVSSPSLATARVVPTDRLQIPDVEPVTPIQDLVERAVSNRPELAETRINIENTKIQLAGSKSQLLPALDLVAAATNNGLAGAVNSIPLPPGSSLFNRAANPTFVGGYGTFLGQLFGRNFPDYSVGFQLNIPLRNRSAQADIALDLLNLRQGELQQRKQLNQISVDVINAVIGVQQSRARYQAAVKSRILAEQTLDAEQKKLALGAGTIFFVIQAQRDVALAQSQEVAALSSYNRSRVALDNATGDVLANNHVQLDEVKSGRISTPPSAIPTLDKP
jgi:outer membrane protein TolC